MACTTASVIAAALNIRDLDAIGPAEVEQIQRLHILLVMFNAMQPGVFALSGWDLVGALPLPAEQVEHLMGDGDTRWINRGGYDLADLAPEASVSAEGLPKARSLYGSLAEQLQRPGSFACQLKRILSVRQAYDIAASKQILIPDVQAPGLLVMVHELPAGKGVQLTALNFSAEPVSETICLPGVAPGPVVDIIHESVEGDLTDNCELQINLDPYEGLALRGERRAAGDLSALFARPGPPLVRSAWGAHRPRRRDQSVSFTSLFRLALALLAAPVWAQTACPPGQQPICLSGSCLCVPAAASDPQPSTTACSVWPPWPCRTGSSSRATAWPAASSRYRCTSARSSSRISILPCWRVRGTASATRWC